MKITIDINKGQSDLNKLKPFILEELADDESIFNTKIDVGNGLELAEGLCEVKRLDGKAKVLLNLDYLSKKMLSQSEDPPRELKIRYDAATQEAHEEGDFAPNNFQVSLKELTPTFEFSFVPDRTIVKNPYWLNLRRKSESISLGFLNIRQTDKINWPYQDYQLKADFSHKKFDNFLFYIDSEGVNHGLNDISIPRGGGRYEIYFRGEAYIKQIVETIKHGGKIDGENHLISFHGTLKDSLNKAISENIEIKLDAPLLYVSVKGNEPEEIELPELSLGMKQDVYPEIKPVDENGKENWPFAERKYGMASASDVSFSNENKLTLAPIIGKYDSTSPIQVIPFYFHYYPAGRWNEANLNGSEPYRLLVKLSKSSAQADIAFKPRFKGGEVLPPYVQFLKDNNTDFTFGHIIIKNKSIGNSEPYGGQILLQSGFDVIIDSDSGNSTDPASWKVLKQGKEGTLIEVNGVVEGEGEALKVPLRIAKNTFENKDQFEELHEKLYLSLYALEETEEKYHEDLKSRLNLKNAVDLDGQTYFQFETHHLSLPAQNTQDKSIVLDLESEKEEFVLLDFGQQPIEGIGDLDIDADHILRTCLDEDLIYHEKGQVLFSIADIDDIQKSSETIGLSILFEEGNRIGYQLPLKFNASEDLIITAFQPATETLNIDLEDNAEEKLHWSNLILTNSSSWSFLNAVPSISAQLKVVKVGDEDQALLSAKEVVLDGQMVKGGFFFDDDDTISHGNIRHISKLPPKQNIVIPIYINKSDSGIPIHTQGSYKLEVSFVCKGQKIAPVERTFLIQPMQRNTGLKVEVMPKGSNQPKTIFENGKEELAHLDMVLNRKRLSRQQPFLFTLLLGNQGRGSANDLLTVNSVKLECTEVSGLSIDEEKVTVDTLKSLSGVLDLSSSVTYDLDEEFEVDVEIKNGEMETFGNRAEAKSAKVQFLISDDLLTFYQGKGEFSFLLTVGFQINGVPETTSLSFHTLLSRKDNDSVLCIDWGASTIKVAYALSDGVVKTMPLKAPRQVLNGETLEAIEVTEDQHAETLGSDLILHPGHDLFERGKAKGLQGEEENNDEQVQENARYFVEFPVAEDAQKSFRSYFIPTIKILENFANLLDALGLDQIHYTTKKETIIRKRQALPGREFTTSPIFQSGFHQLLSEYMEHQIDFNNLVFTHPNFLGHKQIKKREKLIREMLPDAALPPERQWIKVESRCESDAALLGYLLNTPDRSQHFEKDVPRNVLVYDMGASTLDISMARVTFREDDIEIIYSSKMTSLRAGNFVDLEIVKALKEKGLVSERRSGKFALIRAIKKAKSGVLAELQGIVHETGRELNAVQFDAILDEIVSKNKRHLIDDPIGYTLKAAKKNNEGNELNVEDLVLSGRGIKLKGLIKEIRTYFKNPQPITYFPSDVEAPKKQRQISGMDAKSMVSEGAVSYALSKQRNNQLESKKLNECNGFSTIAEFYALSYPDPVYNKKWREQTTIKRIESNEDVTQSADHEWLAVGYGFLPFSFDDEDKLTEDDLEKFQNDLELTPENKVVHPLLFLKFTTDRRLWRFEFIEAEEKVEMYPLEDPADITSSHYLDFDPELQPVLSDYRELWTEERTSSNNN